MKNISLALLVLLSIVFLNPSCLPPHIGGDGKLSIVGTYAIDMAYGFDIKDKYVYMGTNKGLLILDVSNHENPRRVTELELGFIGQVTVLDNVAYLCGGGNGFMIVDVSDVNKPNVLGTYRDRGEIYGFAKSGSYAYVCDRLEGLKVIDIKDLRNPRKISQWSNGGQYWAIKIKDQIGYVADTRDGLEIVDISDPLSLSLIATIPNTEGASGVQLDDKQMCLGTLNGINLFDITNPRVPRLTMKTLSDREVRGGCVSKNLLCAGAGGIVVFDVTNPGEPIRLANWTITGGVHGIMYDGQYIYTAKMGFYILKLLR